MIRIQILKQAWKICLVFCASVVMRLSLWQADVDTTRAVLCDGSFQELTFQCFERDAIVRCTRRFCSRLSPALVGDPGHGLVPCSGYVLESRYPAISVEGLLELAGDRPRWKALAEHVPRESLDLAHVVMPVTWGSPRHAVQNPVEWNGVLHIWPATGDEGLLIGWLDEQQGWCSYHVSQVDVV